MVSLPINFCRFRETHNLKDISLNSMPTILSIQYVIRYLTSESRNIEVRRPSKKKKIWYSTNIDETTVCVKTRLQQSARDIG